MLGVFAFLSVGLSWSSPWMDKMIGLCCEERQRYGKSSRKSRSVKMNLFELLAWLKHPVFISMLFFGIFGFLMRRLTCTHGCMSMYVSSRVASAKQQQRRHATSATRLVSQPNAEHLNRGGLMVENWSSLYVWRSWRTRSGISIYIWHSSFSKATMQVSKRSERWLPARCSFRFISFLFSP